MHFVLSASLPLLLRTNKPVAGSSRDDAELLPTRRRGGLTDATQVLFDAEKCMPRCSIHS